MKKLINPVIMVAGAVALGGCVLSTPDAVGTGDVVRTNGLPFASDEVTGGGTLSTAVTGRTANTDAVSFLGTRGNSSSRVNQITVRGMTEDMIRITYNGEILNLTKVFNGYELRTDGVRHTVEVTPQGAGTAVSTYQYARFPTRSGGDKQTVHFVIGNETNPANLSGTALYSFQLYGDGTEVINGETNPLFIDGSGTINADFATTAVTANASVRIDSSNNRRTNEFTLTGNRIGASFTADATQANCLTSDCVPTMILTGHFYGALGDEVAGVGTIDQGFTTDEGLADVKGNFTFIGAR
jgi:hypothetical protein